MKRYQLRKISLVTAVVTLTSSCAGMHQAGQDYGTAIGCVGGATLGGGLTYLITGDAKKALVGGLIGGVAGCVAGNVWQNREKALAKIAAEEHIAIRTRTLEAQAKSRKEAVGLVAQVEDKGMFDTDSARLSADGLRQVKKLAAAMKEGNQGGVILIVGHTDASGNAQWNQRLSEQRAQNVGRVLEQQGLSAKNLYFQGAGSSRPVADNASVEGRAANRRVELTALASEALLKQQQPRLSALRHQHRASRLPGTAQYGRGEKLTSWVNGIVVFPGGGLCPRPLAFVGFCHCVFFLCVTGIFSLSCRR